MIKFENKTNGRFYYMYSETDLFNELVFCIIRGGKDSCIKRTYGYNSEINIRREINRISKVRIKRGYSLVENSSDIFISV